MESPLSGSETPGSEIKRPRDPTQAKDVFQRKLPLSLPWISTETPGSKKKKKKFGYFKANSALALSGFNRDPGIQKKQKHSTTYKHNSVSSAQDTCYNCSRNSHPSYNACRNSPKRLCEMHCTLPSALKTRATTAVGTHTPSYNDSRNSQP